MTPHIQNDLGDGTGDCLPTCIASILDLPADAVPNFKRLQEETGKDCIMAADKWLRESHGKRFISIEMYDGREGPNKGNEMTEQCILNRLFFANEKELVILLGESPRKTAEGKTKYHAVVGKADCWGYELVHDPHPSGAGLVGQPYGVMWIVSI